jgi:hypothetical protein
VTTPLRVAFLRDLSFRGCNRPPGSAPGADVSQSLGGVQVGVHGLGLLVHPGPGRLREFRAHVEPWKGHRGVRLLVDQMSAI